MDSNLLDALARLSDLLSGIQTDVPIDVQFDVREEALTTEIERLERAIFEREPTDPARYDELSRLVAHYDEMIDSTNKTFELTL